MSTRSELNALLLGNQFALIFKPFSDIEDTDLCLHIDAELVRDRFRGTFDGIAVMTAGTLDVMLGADLKEDVRALHTGSLGYRTCQDQGEQQ